MKAGKILPIVLAVCGLVFWPLPARATLITIQIEAVVDTVNDSGNYLEGQISPGDIITGYYTYESTTPDTNPIPQVADYLHYATPCGISLTVGDFGFKTDPANVDFLVEIINNYTSGGLHDSYIVMSYNNLPLSNGTSVDTIAWYLRDSSATALSSTELPTTAPVLENWQSGNLLRLYGERARYIIDAHVTSAVPEPGTILLLALGSLLLRKRN
jgi:hypothetical protein